MFLPLRSSIEKFVPLTDVEWNMLLAYLEVRTLKKHDCLAEEGKHANEIGFVLEGMLRHYYIKTEKKKQPIFILKIISWRRISVVLQENLPN